jgi:8-oxo-dGTP pyrophosphatase MutT (NUDIX family)
LATPRLAQFALPLQVAAVCYRVREGEIEFLLVKTRGGAKWTFPKGDPNRSLTHGQAAEREAWEEAGVRGTVEERHVHLYLHSKGVVWKPSGVREYVVKAFLLEVDEVEVPHENGRNPTWFSPDDARNILAKGREVKYAKELQALVDRALEQIGAPKVVGTR